MLSDRCLSCPVSLSVCLSVCNVGVLWPNDWVDQDETWHAGRHRPWPHCIGDPAPPYQRGTAPQFSAHICCGQMAGWTKMPLGTEVGLDPSNIVLDGDPAPAPQKRAEPPPNIRPMSIVAKRLDGSRCHMAWR